MADLDTDAIVNEIKNRVASAAETLIRDVHGYLTESISVPVEYEGSRVIRSRPGEPPRMETETYRDSWQNDVVVEGDRVIASEFTDDPLGGWLEHGTDNMAKRPHASVAFERYAEEAIRRFERAVYGQ